MSKRGFLFALGISAGLGLAAACARQPIAVPTRAVVPAVAKQPAPVVTARPELPPNVRLGLQESVCAADPECRPTTLFEGVPNAQGERAVVVTVPTHITGIESRCSGVALWVARLAADRSVIERQAVGSGCDESTPYGGACDGLSLIRVERPTAEAPHEVTATWDAPGPGCGGWTRGSGSIAVALDSLRMVRRSVWSGRAAGPDDSSERAWDFTRMTFKSSWQTDNGDCPARQTKSFAIPQLALDAALSQRTWEGASWDACATTFDAEHGVALRGTMRAKVRLHALVTESLALLVDVIEPEGAKANASLQVCFAPWTTQDYTYCQVGLQPECLHVSLDGRRRSGNTVFERARDKPRFRVQLPEETSALSLAYLDGNGRSLASSSFQRDDATSLGNIFGLGTEVMRCELRPDGFHLAPAPRREERELLNTEGLDD